MQWLTQTQMRVEQMLKSIEKSATQYANSSLVKTAMNTTYSPTDFEQIRDLSMSLYNLQSSDVVITEAFLINLERNWSISLNTMKPLDQLENNKEFWDYAEQPRSIYWSTGTVPANGVESENPVEMITLVHKIPILPQTNKPQGLVVVRISAADIREALIPGNPSNRNYILDRTGTDILVTAEAKEGYQEINQVIARRIGSGTGE